MFVQDSFLVRTKWIPLSPQKETHNIVVGFFFSKKTQIHLRIFLENKKDKILEKNLGFYACLGFLSGTHEVYPSFTTYGITMLTKSPQALCLWAFLFL